MNSSLISKYIPLNTIIHNLDPRVKLFFVICYFIDVFIAHSVGELLILSLFLVLAIILSKTNIAFLIDSVKAILLLLIKVGILFLNFMPLKSIVELFMV